MKTYDMCIYQNLNCTMVILVGLLFTSTDTSTSGKSIKGGKLMTTVPDELQSIKRCYCKDCYDFADAHYCEGSESDHYGHYIRPHHPACVEYVELGDHQWQYDEYLDRQNRQ